MAADDLIKIIPKAKPKISKPLNFLFWFSLLLLVALGALSFFLQNQNLDLETKLEGINKEIALSQIKTDLEKELISSSQKIKDFSKILNLHKTPSKFFEFLKTNCHQKVELTALQLDNANCQAFLSGEAETFEALGEQILILKNNENVESLQVTNVFLNRESKVEFNLNFSFIKDLIEI